MTKSLKQVDMSCLETESGKPKFTGLIFNDAEGAYLFWPRTFLSTNQLEQILAKMKQLEKSERGA